MTESAIVNSWIRQGEIRGDLRTKRHDDLELLNIKFPGRTTPEIRRTIEQEDLTLLADWFRAARADTYEDFLREFRG